MTNQVPIAEGLFTWPAEKPALLSSRCKNCGIASFPAADACMACSGQDVAVEELPGRGVNTITGLIDSGVVSYDVVAQDGMRVRANAGRSSFRRAPTLKKLQQEVKSYVDKLKDDDDQSDDPKGPPKS